MLGKVSSPGVANAAEKPFYDNDVTAVAEMIMRAFPELRLNPRIILAAMDHDIRATRAALAAHEGLEPVHNLPPKPKSPFLAHNLQNFRNVSIDTPQKLLKILTTKIFNSGSEREIMNRLLGYVSLGIEGLWLTYPSP